MSGPNVSLTAGGTLALVGVGVAALVLWKGAGLAKQAASAIGNAAAQAADAVNPLNPDNVFASTVNAVGGAIATEPDAPGKNADGSWTLGGALFDLWNPGTAQAVRDINKPVFTGGATGSW